VGALEYDPEIPVRQRHREFLQQSVVFKEVVPIGDPAVRAKIHQTYRMGYLKVRVTTEGVATVLLHHRTLTGLWKLYSDAQGLTPARCWTPKKALR